MREVTCPECGEISNVPVPEADVKLKVSPYRRAFGDYTEIECLDGHIFWVYYC
ncbi:hypothetical protein [Natronolimnohabitans innermongolicus]